MVLCLGEPLGGLCHVGCCCYFPHWRILCFRAIFPCHQHLTLASQTCECLQQLWALTWLISFALLLPGFSVTVLPRALRFWGGILYPQAFFTLHTFPRFLALFVVFVTQMRAGTPNPGFSSVPTLTGLSLTADVWTWTTHIVITRPLIYQLRQWATKYRVKTNELNMF